MHYIKRWKRFVACGCSHGELADPKALAAVLRFKESWRPDFTAHLGDAIDCTAFRVGAKGNKDEAAPVPPDVFAGLEFLERLRPQVYLFGNHEDRLANLAQHFNAIVAGYASCILDEIRATAKRLKCQIVPYNFKSFFPLGNFKLLHGTIFTENAARDHAEAWGNCIHAHNHRASLQTGRRTDNPTGISVGTLMDVAKAGYAKNRKATYAWSAGFVWGEYIEGKQTVAWLHQQPQDATEWRLPV